MTFPTLSELLRLQEEATPGKWHQVVWPDDGRKTRHLRTAKSNETAYTSSVAYIGIGDIERDCDLAFIAAARNFDLKALATQYEAMREWIEKAGDHSHYHHDDCSIHRPNAPCSCGYDALRTSLDTKARGDRK